MNPAAPDDDPLWYQDAMVYELHVRAFRDSDGDGAGDFRGLVEKLDYLQELGVTALWLLPFYPSPLRDDGYDIADYLNIHPTYGTLADFKLLLREAHRRGLRVITELVLNHTSDQHPWFQRARRAPPGSPARDFYVWSDRPDRYPDARIIFKDFESSNWTLDPVAGAFYWHRFYSHQPDLNYDNPAVRRAMLDVVDFWLEMGVDGLRLDAVPYLYQREGTNCENLPETHAFLRELRRHVDARFRNRLLLAEANQWPEDAVAYFGAGDECHMAFHFPMMPRMFMALHMEDRFPLVDILGQTPALPAGAQWALFLRNHDELTLEMVTDEERDYMYRVYANDPQARINLGIRRRLAPLLGNHRRQIELLFCLLLSLPGTPVIYYGDEIGMGDNIYLGDRNSVRTPMQWSDGRNAGFSTANPQALYLPAIIDPEYHYSTVNVETQQRNMHSLLWWVRRLVALRKQHRAFGRGSLEVLHPGNRKVLAFIRRHGDERILVVANLSRYVQYVELDLGRYRGRVLVEMFGRTRFPTVGTAPYPLTLGPHSFYWFTLEPARRRESARAPVPVVDAATGWPDALLGPGRSRLAAILPSFLATRRWFAEPRAVKAVTVVDAVHFPDAVLLLAQVEYQDGPADLCTLPVAAAPDADARPRAGAVIARLRTGGEEWVLQEAVDALAHEDILPGPSSRRRTLKGAVGEVVTVPLRTGRPLRAAEAPELAEVDAVHESVAFRGRYVFKLYRMVAPGLHPELEVLRFLGQGAGCPLVPDLAGALEYRRGSDPPVTIGVVEAFVPHQGTAWTLAREEAESFFEAVRAQPGDLPAASPFNAANLLRPLGAAAGRTGSFLDRIRLLGRRLAELHRALAAAPDQPDLAPDPFTPFDQRALYHAMRSEAERHLETLAARLDHLPEMLRHEATRVLQKRTRVVESFRALVEVRVEAVRIRCHGHLDLGEVLFTGNDFVFVGFEGDPDLPLSVRRLKRSPLRDVAGLLYSCCHVAAAALRRQVDGGAVPAVEVPYYEEWSRLWQLQAAAALLAEYREAAAEAPFLPPDPDALRVMLDRFLLDLALRDLGRSLRAGRRDAAIPLRAIAALVRR